jgi:hypothetical protein
LFFDLRHSAAKSGCEKEKQDGNHQCNPPLDRVSGGWPSVRVLRYCVSAE